MKHYKNFGNIKDKLFKEGYTYRFKEQYLPDINQDCREWLIRDGAKLFIAKVGKHDGFAREILFEGKGIVNVTHKEMIELFDILPIKKNMKRARDIIALQELKK